MKKEWLSDLLSGDDQRAQEAAARIAAVGEHALPELKTMLDDPEEEIRWWAVRALAAMDHPEIPDLLRKALHDEGESVRQCAALALRERPNPEALPDLVELLEAGDTLTRRLAGDALIALGALAVPELMAVMGGGSVGAQVEAARGLAKIGDKRAIAPLYHLLDSPSALLSYWAEEGLENMGVGMVFFKPGKGE
ncbi:MAG: HEAT repeat domain-containing protein [Anaerolineales bacterium]